MQYSGNTFYCLTAERKIQLSDWPIILLPADVSHHASGGCNIEGEDESWDFGTGAGFYVDSTQDPWKTNYRMYSYVTEEVRLICVTCSP